MSLSKSRFLSRHKMFQITEESNLFLVKPLNETLENLSNSFT